MNDKFDELHLIYKMIGNYGFCTVKSLLEAYDNLQQELQRKDNEIKQLREDIVNHIKIAGEYKEQMIIKDNNWNELKRYIKASDDCWDLQAVLDKMKEIENGK